MKIIKSVLVTAASTPEQELTYSSDRIEKFCHDMKASLKKTSGKELDKQFMKNNLVNITALTKTALQVVSK